MNQYLTASPFFALAAALVAFGIAWLIRSFLANRAVDGIEQATGDEIRGLRLGANQLRAQMTHLTDDLAAARSQLSLSEESARRVGAELEAQLKALDEARKQRNFLELELGRVRANADRLIERIEKLAPLVGAVQTLEDEVIAERARTSALSRKLDEVVQRRTELESQATRASARVQELEQELREAAASAHQEAERRARQLEAWQAERARLRAELADADQRHRDAIAARRQVERERDEARARIRAVEVSVHSREAKYEITIGALEAQVARLEPLRRQLEDREQLIRVLATERDARTIELERLERLASEGADRREARIRSLEAELAGLPQARDRVTDLEGRLSKLTRERDQLAATLQRNLTELETQRAETKHRDARFRALVEEFRGMAAARDQEIAGLKAHLEGLETQLLQRPVRDSLSMPSLTNTVLGDDLKRIRGIGPTLERVLNAEGVYLYRQIATWTAEDVARIAERLRAFPDRIHRDEWIANARSEHVRKYGQEP